MNDLMLPWWAWFVLGVALLALELLTPGGLFLLFFGVAAIVVGTLAGLGLVQPLWEQVLLFAVLAIVAVALLRRVLQERLGLGVAPAHEVDSLVGETALALEDLPADGIGKAELRGSAWSAHNIGHEAVLRGQRCRVVRVEGLMLWVRAA